LERDGIATEEVVAARRLLRWVRRVEACKGKELR